MIQTKSVNPSYIPGGPEPTIGHLVPVHPASADIAGESRMAEMFAERMKRIGAEVHWDEALPGRPAVYALVRGSGDKEGHKKVLGLDVHMDTVGVVGCEDPFSGRLDPLTGRLHGRGACDTKAMLAVGVSVLERAHAMQRVPRHDVLLAGTVDEEAGQFGALRLLD